jgi:hypothetical protein
MKAKKIKTTGVSFAKKRSSKRLDSSSNERAPIYPKMSLATIPYND